ncbi:cytochrome P450 [Lentzea cavernae]|uniref:Cytochrome P450 n=1 Tax=Lentzea cavernae TaxID=2020703 RepID=A0ABQ3MFB6_9PSEU|nr:cytochrome P450 [Lentzea cavernae]GHH39550.1 cytochrome P450 [Lentzea cavernae]
MTAALASAAVAPGPPRRAALAVLAKMARNRLQVMSSMSARYGDVVRLPLGPKTLNYFNHPDHAKHVLAENAANYVKGIGLTHARRALGDGLLTSDGDLWRKQRKVIQPVFQAKRMARYGGVIAQEAADTAERLRSFRGETVDIRAEMTELTLRVLGRVLLDADLSEFHTLGASFEAVQDQAMFEMMSLSAVPTWMPLPRQLKFRRARADLQRVVDRLVADGARPGGDDVVSRLVESTRAEVDPSVGRVRMRDELVTLLLAGHETTASTLSWAFHLLDRHPHVAAAVHDEVVGALGDRMPVFEDLHALPYTSAVLQEVMRLYPPVWILPRQAREADVIGGYRVEAGADVLICPYTLHRHPAFWEDPERFDPGRFTGDAAGRPTYAYIPFGAGPRYCVGNHLGMMEATFVLATVTRAMRLTGVPGRAAVPEPMLTLRMRDGLPMTVSDW